MRKRSTADARTAQTMVYDAERRLKKGLLTLSDYNEIMGNFQPLLLFDTVETINSKVMEFFKLYGVHIETRGAGWVLKWY